MANAEQDFNAAQTGIDPVTGRILSPNERKIRFDRFRRTRISSQKVFGNNAAANQASVSEPQTSAIVRRDSNTIVNLKKEVETLKKSQTENIVSFRNFISSIQENFKVISVNVTDLGTRILGVNNLLTADSALEQKKDEQDQEQERKLAEKGARAGKESLLERRIQSALMAPIRAITARTQSIFQKLMDAFTMFFFGWITNKLIDTFKAQADGNTTLLQKIFGNVIGGVTFFFKSLQFINKSLRGIVGIVTGITKILAKFITSTLGIIFKGLQSLGKGVASAGEAIVKAGKNLLGIGAKSTALATTEAAGRLATKEGTEAAGKMLAKEGAEAAGKVGLKKIPGISLIAGLGFGAERLYAGDTFGAGLEVASGIAGMFPGLGTGISFAIDAYSLKRRIDQGTEENKASQKAQVKSNLRPSAPGTPQTPKVEPQVTAAPKSSELQISMPDSFNRPLFAVDTENNMNAFDSSGAPSQPSTTVEGTQTTVSGIVPAQTQRIPTPTVRVGPEPQQKPNVVMMSAISPGSNQPPSTALKSSTDTAASDVPFIPSGNPDNFYTLYSQVNYNVLI